MKKERRQVTGQRVEFPLVFWQCCWLTRTTSDPWKIRDTYHQRFSSKNEWKKKSEGNQLSHVYLEKGDGGGSADGSYSLMTWMVLLSCKHYHYCTVYCVLCISDWRHLCGLFLSQLIIGKFEEILPSNFGIWHVF